MRRRWLLAVCIPPALGLAYGFGVVAFTLGATDDHVFSSRAYQLKQANLILKLAGKRPARSMHDASVALLPPFASNPTWDFGAGDDNWLVTLAWVNWRDSAGKHRARWVIRQCVDWKWSVHMVEVAALTDEAESLTPTLSRRDAIHGQELDPDSVLRPCWLM
jgi:hypothetical protein